MVIAFLRHLPEFDLGDLRSKEDEEKLDLDVNGDLGHFGRIFEGNRRRIEESGCQFSEKRRIGNPRKGIENQRKQKKIWGLFSRDFGSGLLKKKEKMGF
ncbi:hypothetical protein Dsin_022191 [Dipteronia sinensis]|uniref:Uncharacterized protein n=1 Tax=Dipteronia sinensis TaxID=43782 RepID=A0AAE0DZP8_9ROSI|nr:hypothetical protein Dsin_022191 [Dipteronia sinensis]